MIWVNFKIYRQTFGDGALKLAEICQRLTRQTGVKIIPVVSPFDLWRIKKEVGGEVWLQHLDHFSAGAKTGWLSGEQAIAAGADGTLLNHSEHKLPPGRIRQILKLLKKTQPQFKVMVCFRSKGQIKGWLKKLRPLPDFVAYEPPELIGGTISVSQAQPGVIKSIVDLLPNYDVIVGAGIHSREDVCRAQKLGAKGVLVSSAVVKAENPQQKLKELIGK